MDFLKLVNDGVEKSNKALAAVAEVDEIYKRINAELKKYPAGELEVQRKVSAMAQISSIADGIAGGVSGASIESEYFKHDRIAVVLKVNGKSFSEDVAGWKQRVTGYPCILKFDGQELTCGSDSHLLNGMSELLSSVRFGNAINRLRKAAEQSAAAQQQKHGPVVRLGSDKSDSPEAELAKNNRPEKQQLKLTNKAVAPRVGAKSATAPKLAKKTASSKSKKTPAVPTASKRPAASRISKKPSASKGAQEPETSESTGFAAVSS